MQSASDDKVVTQEETTVTAQILLVEDEPDVRDYITRALKRHGYNIEVANSGDAALAILRENRAFDLVLTDIVMPGKIDGIALSRHVEQNLTDIRVIYMTGYSDQVDTALDTNKLLRKPFSTAELTAKISAALIA